MIAGPRRARPSARRGVDRRAARRRRDDGIADRRVRLVHGREGRVHLDDVLDARRRAEPDLRRAAPLRRHRDVLRASAHALVGGRRRGRAHARRRCCSRTSTRWTSASTRTRRASRCCRRRTGRTAWTPDRARNVLIGFVVLSLARDRPPARAPVGNASGPRARRRPAPRLGDRRPDVGRERLEHVLRGDLGGHRPAVRLDRPRDRRRADALPRATAHRLQRHLADGVLEPVAQARLVDRRQRSRPRPDALARPRQRRDRRDHATPDGGRVRRRRPRDRHRRHARREATPTTRRGRRRSGASSRSFRRCGSRTRREA